jgi:hypothetical protein
MSQGNATQTDGLLMGQMSPTVECIIIYSSLRIEAHHSQWACIAKLYESRLSPNETARGPP